MTGAAGLGGPDDSIDVLASGVTRPSTFTGARIGVSSSAIGRGVSGGLASVEMSDRASEGVSKPEDDVEFGNAE